MKYTYFYVLIIAVLASALAFSGCLGFGDDDTNNQVTVGDASPTTGTSSSNSSDNESVSSSVNDTYEPYHADEEDWYTPGSGSSNDEDESEESEDEETEEEKGERIPVLVYSANQEGLFDNNTVVFLQLKKTRTFPRTEVDIKEGDVIRLRNMDDVHRTVFRVHSAEGFFKDRDLWRNYDVFIQFNKKGKYTLELYNGAEEEGKLTAFSGDKPSTLTVTVK